MTLKSLGSADLQDLCLCLTLPSWYCACILTSALLLRPAVAADICSVLSIHGDLLVRFARTSTVQYQQCVVSVLIIAELAKGHRCSRNLEPNFCPGGDLNSQPLD